MCKSHSAMCELGPMSTDVASPCTFNDTLLALETTIQAQCLHNVSCNINLHTQICSSPQANLHAFIAAHLLDLCYIYCSCELERRPSTSTWHNGGQYLLTTFGSFIHVACCSRTKKTYNLYARTEVWQFNKPPLRFATKQLKEGTFDIRQTCRHLIRQILGPRAFKSSLTRTNVMLSKSVRPTKTIFRNVRGNCCKNTPPHVMALPTFSSLS